MARKKKLTGYFIEDHEDIMERLEAGTATAADQKLIAAELYESDIYHDSYNFCTEQIEPFVARPHNPDGELPASVGESLGMLLEFWNANKANPACNEEVMGLVRKALSVGAKYSLVPCIEALAKLDSVTQQTIIQRAAKASPKTSFLAPGFPSRLIKWREYAGLTQKELAKKVRLPENTVMRYELGTMTPQPRTIRSIVNALNIPLSKLVDGENEQQQPIGVSSATKRAADEDSE